jgi:hypothetical protein
MSQTERIWTSLLPADSTFDRARIAVSARDRHVTYADGSTRLCATSGLWNVPLGYGNAAVSEAVERATRDASYLSLFRAPHRLAADAADALVGLAGPKTYERVIFSTSGGAANDAMMKLVRQYWAVAGHSRRTVVVGLMGSYHGTMYGSHALSGDALLQPLYSLDRRGIRHIVHDDGGEQLEMLLRREGDRIAAVVLEPVLGSGAVPLDPEFLRRLASLRDRHGFLIVADEVATGFGRTGRLFASEAWPVPPDVLVVSKALTNGVTAAAALLVGPTIARAFVRSRATFAHAETQAGTPVAAAATLAVIDELQRLPPLTLARLGDRLADLADALVHDGYAKRWSGSGCFIGIRLVDAEGSNVTAEGVGDVVARIASEGVLVHPGPGAIQLIPAYAFTAEDLAAVDGAIRRGIDAWRAEAA